MSSIPINTAIESARLDSLFKASKSALMTNILLTLLAAIALRDMVGPEIVITWLSLALVVTVFRFQLSKLHTDSSKYANFITFRIGVLLSAIIWAVVGFVIFPASDQQHQMFLVFTFAGLTAGGMIAFSSDYVSTIIHSTLILLPLIFNLSISSYFDMAAAGLLYLAFVILSSLQIYRNQINNIKLRFLAVENENQTKYHADKLEFNNRILNLINTEYPLPDILNAIASHFEKLQPNFSCSIKLLNDETRTLEIVAAPSLPTFYIKSIHGIKINDNNPHGAAVLQRNPIIVEDIQHNSPWSYHHDLNKKAGLHSYCLYPLINSNGQVIGTFDIYHNIPNTKIDDKVKLLINDYLNLTLLAIENNRVQNDLKISAVAFQAQNPILIMDSNMRVLQSNQSFTELTGYSEKEVKGKIFGMNIPSQSSLNIFSSIWKNIDNVDVIKEEFDDHHKDGSVYSTELTITKLKNSNGRVSNFVASFKDNTLSKATAREIEDLAFYDHLTKLPNRKLLVDRLKHTIENHNEKISALLFLDLDHFKTLNDSLGHHIGDMLLQEVATRLVENLRENDTAARLGGDEYVILLENLGDNIPKAKKRAELISQKILDELSQAYQLDNHLYQITASIGVALIQNDSLSSDDILKNADIAMYEAKKAGRNKIRFFDQKMHEEIKSSIKIKNELTDAIKLKQLELYYQKQTDDFGICIGAEALIRWHHPERGLLSPAHFISLAEETGQIIPLGRWILDTACKQLKSWQHNTNTCNITLSINVSANQFLDRDFMHSVIASVNKYGINPNLLKLELTESLLLENINTTIEIMNKLNEIGINFSLDDFGTGYSSLRYLKHLPLNQLKIDKSFTQDIATNNNDKTIVHTILAMANSLNIDVIAEGVETVEQLNILKIAGCKYFQGYLFGSPLPINEFNDSFKQDKTHIRNFLKVVSNN
jgi:diguanylate cyclase (GGDEF)-like protein/PAS domain S-box-containing protein